MSLVIIKYNAGNIQSVLYALERIGTTATVTDNHDDIFAADRVIFPGVGEASSAMKYLKEKGLDKVLKNLEQPTLGICLGMQLMCSYSEENKTDCLDIFDVKVKRFNDQIPGLKVPQVGWNNIFDLKSPIFKEVPDNTYCYFVHGYYAALCKDTVATADYTLHYSAALQKKNFYGVQFHPEKSAAAGEQMLRNFLEVTA
ncbi:MAG: imidazole glycerol phosphate synthase subunit HisH [Chitinophagaceae bacterium]|nr:MAG: imidazole glycerol phosphate synthase subunit HisH [Chitinophagaceae bacterium]